MQDLTHTSLITSDQHKDFGMHERDGQDICKVIEFLGKDSPFEGDKDIL